MTVLQILIAARELISDPKRWTQGAYARKANGCSCNPNKRTAVCWCSEGAVERIRGGIDDEGQCAELVLLDAIGEKSIATLNDHGTHADVMAMFDAAIEAEKAKVTP